MIVLTAKYFAKPGRETRSRACCAGWRRSSVPMNPVARSTTPIESADNADIFLLYEHYADQAALDAHRNTRHFKEIIEGVIVPLVEKRERELYRCGDRVSRPTMKLVCETKGKVTFSLEAVRGILGESPVIHARRALDLRGVKRYPVEARRGSALLATGKG